MQSGHFCFHPFSYGVLGKRNSALAGHRASTPSDESTHPFSQVSFKFEFRNVCNPMPARPTEAGSKSKTSSHH